MRVVCFPPVINKECKVIVLGSMPSVKSRENNFYYSNPNNRFWKIMSEITGVDFTVLNNDRKAKELLRLNIALFDVFSSCEIDGSLDGNIKNAEFNDLPALIKDTDVEKIYITSKKAYNAFIKRFGEYFNAADIPVISLPSTSGANRGKYKTDEQLLLAWKELFSV